MDFTRNDLIEIIDWTETAAETFIWKFQEK